MVKDIKIFCFIGVFKVGCYFKVFDKVFEGNWMNRGIIVIEGKCQFFGVINVSLIGFG